MKAIVKSDRKIIVDIVAQVVDPFLGINGYVDKDGKQYRPEEIEFVEYYGG